MKSTKDPQPKIRAPKVAKAAKRLNVKSGMRAGAFDKSPLYKDGG